MAQYDVYPNPSPRSRDSVPYLVDVQSGLLARLRTRLTIPLSRLGVGLESGLPRRLAMRVEVAGEPLMLLAHLAAVMESRHLKKPVSSLAARAPEIVDAIDAVVSGV